MVKKDGQPLSDASQTTENERTQKRNSLVCEKWFVNNEVGLPTYMEAQVGVRFLLVKGIKASIATRYWDYQKSTVETLSTIAKPKGAAETPVDPPTKP